MTTLTLDVQKIRDAAATSPEARKALEVLAPEAFGPDRTKPITDRVVVRRTIGRSYIQVPIALVREALKDNDWAPYLCVSDGGVVGVAGHIPNDHDCPTLTGFTSTQDR